MAVPSAKPRPAQEEAVLNDKSVQWFVVNPQSGSYDESLVAEVCAHAESAGQPIDRIVEVGADDLPDARSARGVDRILVMTGDGTVSAVHEALSGWPGELLVLPGGTMNLLSRALHGEAEPLDVVDAVLAGKARSIAIPLITVGEFTAISGLFAGPTTAWGDVREQLRQVDVKGLVETVPQAIAATLGEQCVTAQGVPGAYPAFYLQPGEGGITLFGVRAEGAGDLLAHGWAWLKGDFREGPVDRLGVHEALDISGSEAGGTLSLLVDGEKRETSDPAVFSAVQSQVRFLSLNGRANWS